ncbi:flagellar hook protein FlgE [Massilia endophytica]|uniref:flagellar hook protein FlgE n=1 Tax=Massilia endophytica TaxID=2899220 RepID=UPI001E4F398C|nr:flagellar hook-basal body complex protein [Massilia endophytica]UGQ48980.1 flagellar hook-basal body complex protein [Massilia endophytica]
MSFDIALSGIQAINEQLDTISNNIANANTYGFKSSRANFSAMYAGTTPVGTQVTSMTQSIGLNGGILNTGRTMDASINGRGFFAVKDGTGQVNYTRVGIFNKDVNDMVVDANGRKVQGYSITPPSTVPGPLGDLKIRTGLIDASPTTNVKFTANLSKDWIPPTATFDLPDVVTDPTIPVVPTPDSYNMTKTSLVYDSRGTQHSVTQYFRALSATQVRVYTAFDGTDISVLDAALPSPIDITFGTDGQIAYPAPPAPQELKNPITIDLSAQGALNLVFDVDYTGTTYQAGDAVTSTNEADGYSAGAYVGVELQDDGGVIAKYSNGQRQRVGIVALATFSNEEALTSTDNTSWIATSAAGTPNFSEPGVGLAGTLSATTLEGSNVDITAELVGLMTSQRNYQANSKVITTENQMLQSLMQAM